ncbi:MAG: flavodoxin family protein [Candidatus Riflebacteria bacterium]|nr:flavodoxin family protein [Candidatus Riflebacteria bacterium]
MKISIFNGNPDCNNQDFDNCLSSLAVILEKEKHELSLLQLREMEYHHCIGCLDCWVKTPGICVFKDDHVKVLRSFLSSDLVIFASPLIVGFSSALLKKAQDRLLPVILPYIDVSTGECRHYLRYGKAPVFGIIYQPEEDTDSEDLSIFTELWTRFSRNAHSKVAFVRPIQHSVQELSREIARM